MPVKDTHDRFGLVSIFFHWTMAAAIITAIAIGWILDTMAKGPDKIEMVATHKLLGIAILTMAILRLGWRLLSPAPKPSKEQNPKWHNVARAGHFALMALMVLVPLSGWAMSNAAGHPVSFFGLFAMPELMEASKGSKEVMSWVHTILADTFALLIIGHILFALKHHFIFKDNTLKRMLGIAPKPNQAPRLDVLEGDKKMAPPPEKEAA